MAESAKDQMKRQKRNRHTSHSEAHWRELHLEACGKLDRLRNQLRLVIDRLGKSIDRQSKITEIYRDNALAAKMREEILRIPK